MMNKIKRIVLVRFHTDLNYKLLPMEYYNNHMVDWAYSLDNAYEHIGDILIYNNEYNESIISLDKKYRHLFNKYSIVLIYNKTYSSYSLYKSKWFDIYTIGEDIKDSKFINRVIDEYESKNIKLKFNKDKKEKIKILYNYIKKYETRKTKDIVKDLNINERSIQRYMHDLNSIYHNIGYDYSLNEWYFIKK